MCIRDRRSPEGDGSPDRGGGDHCGERFLFSGAEPYIRQQHFRPWHRAVQFCAAALVGHYDDPERRASHHRVFYLRQRIWRKDRIHPVSYTHLFYGMPQELRDETLKRLPEDIREGYELFRWNIGQR